MTYRVSRHVAKSAPPDARIEASSIRPFITAAPRAETLSTRPPAPPQPRPAAGSGLRHAEARKGARIRAGAKRGASRDGRCLPSIKGPPCLHPRESRAPVSTAGSGLDTGAVACPMHWGSLVPQCPCTRDHWRSAGASYFLDPFLELAREPLAPRPSCSRTAISVTKSKHKPSNPSMSCEAESVPAPASPHAASARPRIHITGTPPVQATSPITDADT